ncbi:MAG: hypothetical protein AB4426_15175 [Xenococcaceae cyanobacterium]
MSFQISDFNDLIRLLQEHPEWRIQLRDLLLSEDFLALPRIVRELAEAQKNTEIQLQALIEQTRRNEERLERVERRLDRIDERLDRIDERLDHIDERLDHIDERLDHMDTQIGKLRGKALEQNYRENAHAYFGRLLRKIRLVSQQHLADLLEDHLSAEDFQDALLIDLVVRGRPRDLSPSQEVWLAVEVSTVIDRSDVLRALRRAKLIQQTGTRTLAVVAGEAITTSANDEASHQKVVLLQNGKVKFWDEAIAAAS